MPRGCIPDTGAQVNEIAVGDIACQCVGGQSVWLTVPLRQHLQGLDHGSLPQCCVGIVVRESNGVGGIACLDRVLTVPRASLRICACRDRTGRYVQEMETINLGKADGLPPVDWATVVEKLEAGSAPGPDALNSRTTWLCTVNEDGSPHVTAVGALWVDGTFWFQTGTGTRKGRNVARDPRCSVAVSIRDADVVIEGDAARVKDPNAVARIAKAWSDSGWPAEPDQSGSGITAPFNAPSLGPPPWNVYRIEPRSATVVSATEPGGLTRFRF
jgi:Pyridoxamine 5'-phosphate oxidase